ncbi:MAG TPA: VWA domain-containing protein, partial [Polyangia bacterium]|nr:VWA domain-containing protein [Polyangia bacterium]
MKAFAVSLALAAALWTTPARSTAAPGQTAPVAARRASLNLCLAIDRSESMQGEKIASAREAALAALRRLGPADIVSVVAYDDVVQVLVPATRASERVPIEAGLRKLRPHGGAALYAGVIKCAGELSKFSSRNRLDHIVVLSGGTASVGPRSPFELGVLGGLLREDGISVVMVGLAAGPSEAVTTALATASGGRQLRAPRPEELGGVLDQALAVGQGDRAARALPQARARPPLRGPREVAPTRPTPVLRTIEEMRRRIGEGPL